MKIWFLWISIMNLVLADFGSPWLQLRRGYLLEKVTDNKNAKEINKMKEMGR